MDFEIVTKEFKNIEDAIDLEYRVCSECHKIVIALEIEHYQNISWFSQVDKGEKIYCKNHLAWDLIFARNNFHLSKRKN